MRKCVLPLCLLIFFALIITGCYYSRHKIVIGMVPYNNPADVIKDFNPIKEYIENETGIDIEVVVTGDYLGLIEFMKAKKVDIGWYGPFSYVAGDSVVKLEPLVVQYRKGSGIGYFSQIIVRSDSGIRNINDLRGKRFAFVETGSTSGFVIPSALFKSRDIDIQQYFTTIKYSGTHDSVAIDVINKNVDAGAMDDIVLNSMVDTGKLKREDVKVIWKSDVIPGSPYVARSDLDKTLKDKFKAAMLSIHEKAPQALKTHDQRVEKFVECDSSTYNSIRNTAKILGEEFIKEKFLKKK